MPALGERGHEVAQPVEAGAHGEPLLGAEVDALEDRGDLEQRERLVPGPAPEVGARGGDGRGQLAAVGLANPPAALAVLATKVGAAAVKLVPPATIDSAVTTAFDEVTRTVSPASIDSTTRSMKPGCSKADRSSTTR